MVILDIKNINKTCIYGFSTLKLHPNAISEFHKLQYRIALL